MNLNQKEIGQRVKEIRVKNGFTQQQFADALGITLNTVSKIEPGMRMPSIDLMANMAVLYGESLDWIVLGKK